MSGPHAKHEPRPRFRARVRVRPKAQLTLPEEIRHALGVREGDDVEFTIHEDGTIAVRGYVSLPSDQLWFFTREGLAAKRRADDEIAAGGGKVHRSAMAMFAHLATLGATDSDADL